MEGMFSVSWLFSGSVTAEGISFWLINACGAVGGMKIHRRNRST
jgi:hypothetical protein